MDLRLYSWNGITINSDSDEIKSIFPPGSKSNLSSDAVLVNRAGDFPFLSTTVLQNNPLIIEVYIKSASQINTYRETIKKYFNIIDRQRHDLVAIDRNDGDRQYYVTGFITGLRNHGQEQNNFDITFRTEYPYWRLVTPSVDSWDITATGQTTTISNIGNINVPPIITIIPTTTKTKGYKYRRYIPIYNTQDKTYISPLDITNGGLDVQTLIDAGKIQADGDDFRVWQDGAFADRWLYEMDSDSDPAKCWINFNLSHKKEATTSATFDTDDTTLYLVNNRDNKAFLQQMKVVFNKSFLLDSEMLGFADSDISILDFTVSNVTRGQKNSTIASHSASATLRHIEHDLWILYGDSDATAPDVDNDFKPIFDLLSTNQIWTFTNFWDNTAERPGEWQDEVISSKTGLSHLYTDSDASYVNPSVKLGMSMEGTADFQVANEAGTLDWLFYHPARITNVKYSGDYRTVDSDNSWPATVGLQYLQPDGTWKLGYSDSNFPPHSSDSWIAFDSFDVSITIDTNTIRFVMDGQLNSVINAKAQWHADTVFNTYDSDDLPVISVGGENTINFFDFKLTNSTTGEYIKVTTPCPLNTALTIDCEKKLAYLADGTRVPITLSSNRQQWLDLQSGNNSLQYDDVGTVAVHVNVTHRDRTL